MTTSEDEPVNLPRRDEGETLEEVQERLSREASETLEWVRSVSERSMPDTSQIVRAPEPVMEVQDLREPAWKKWVRGLVIALVSVVAGWFLNEFF